MRKIHYVIGLKFGQIVLWRTETTDHDERELHVIILKLN